MGTIKIGTFGELRHSAMTIHPTIAEHVRSKVDPDDLETLGENQVINAYRAALTCSLIQYGIELNGEELYCSDSGLDPYRIPARHQGIEPIEEARACAALAVGDLHVDLVVTDLYR